MTRAYNNGWEFVKVGGEYVYRESGYTLKVKVLEDNSDDEYYRFKLQVSNPMSSGWEKDRIFDILHIKDGGGHFNGMIQFYEVGI